MTADGAINDRFGRRIDYLRVSLTDRCNFRCRYCMPTQGLDFLPDDGLLTASEIERVVRAAAAIGFRKVRLTGGEPLLRRNVVEIVERIADINGIDDVAMTTNGARLAPMAEALKAAGLRRVNVHVDSLNKVRMADLMLWSDLDDVWAGIEAAEQAGLVPMKLNAVIARGYNEHDVVDLARLSIERDWAVRFIELMPLGAGAEASFSIERYVPNSEIAARIERELGSLEAVPSSDPADEARSFRLPGARGTVGFISPVSEPYCGTCNRMRLTADGRLHLCLLHDDELDLREVLRGGGGEEELSAMLERAIAAKPTGHALAQGIHTERRRMHAIGG
jgi:GTP 3',8-cyclase